MTPQTEAIAREAAQLAVAGDMTGYAEKIAELVVAECLAPKPPALADMSELDNLRRIAKHALAWKTADGVWVHGRDKVHSCGNENRLENSPFKPWHFSITADLIEPNLRQYYFSSAEAAAKHARAEFDAARNRPDSASGCP